MFILPGLPNALLLFVASFCVANAFQTALEVDMAGESADLDDEIQGHLLLAATNEKLPLNGTLDLLQSSTNESSLPEVHIGIFSYLRATSQSWMFYPGMLMVCVLSFAILNEGCASCLGKSLHVSTSRRPLQTIYVMQDMLSCMDLTIVIPASYDLAVHYGASSMFSGLLISAFVAVTPIGILLGGWLAQPWNYSVLRRTALIATCALATLDFSFGVLVLGGGESLGPYFIWILIIVRAIAGLSGGISVVINFLALRATPADEMTPLSVLRFAGMNLGTGLGPMVSSIVLMIAWNTNANLTSKEKSAAPMMVMSLIWALQMAASSVFIPLTSINKPSLEEEKREEKASQVQKPVKLESQPEDLSTDDRKSVALYCLSYAFERGFTVSAVEAATSFILETQYGWKTSDVGWGLVVVCVVSVLVAFLILGCRSFLSSIRESQYLLVMSFFVVPGCVMLFDFPGSSAIVLLAANTIIYASAQNAYGFLDGFANRAALPDSKWYCIESMMALKGVAANFARFCGPPGARILLGLGNSGRSSYAVVQTVLGVLGFCSICKTVWIIRSAQVAIKEGKLAEENESVNNDKSAMRNDVLTNEADEGNKDEQSTIDTDSMDMPAGEVWREANKIWSRARSFNGHL